MSNRQDRQGVRTPADVERKYGLGKKLDNIFNLLEAHESAQKELESENDELSKDLGELRKDFESSTGEFNQTAAEMQETIEGMKSDMEVNRQEFENTKTEFNNSLDEMNGSLDEMVGDINGIRTDMKPLAEFSDGEYSGIAGFVARANADSATVATLLEFSQDNDITLAMFMAEAAKEFATIESVTLLENNTNSAIAGVKQEARETYATIEAMTKLETDTNKSIAGVKQEASETYATIESLTKFENETNEAIAGVRQEASETFATIESVTALDTKTTDAIAGVKQEASETYATIESLASFESETNEAIAGVKQEASEKYATIESVASLETDTTNAIAGLKSEVSSTYAKQSAITELDTKHTNALAGFEQEVSDTYATQDMVSTLRTDTSNAIAGMKQEVSDTYAKQESLTALETATSNAIAGVKSEADAKYATQAMLSSYVSESEQTEAIAALEQEVSDTYAKISQIAEVTDANGNVTTAAIVAQINNGKSSVLIKADRIDLSGYATFSDLPKKTSELTNDSGFQNASGVTTIVGGMVTTDYVEALGIKVAAANITGSLTIGQLPSTVAETSDIPTAVSDLANDSGYQTQSGVVSIIDGRITADYIEALGIHVGAAQIDDTLTIGQLPSTVAKQSDIPTSTSDLTNDSGFQNASGVTSIVKGVVTTDYVNALGITVDAANITGTLTIGKLPSTVAQKSDIPSNVSDLTNDAGYATQSDIPSNVSELNNDAGYTSRLGVTTIIDGRITTDYVNALGITAKSVDVDSLSAISANLGTVTAGILQSSNYAVNSSDTITAGMLINLNLGVINTPNFKVYANGNVLVDGTLRSTSGQLGSLDIDEMGLTCGNIHLNGYGLNGYSTYLESPSGTEVTETFEMTSSGSPALKYTYANESNVSFSATYRAGRGANHYGFIKLASASGTEYSLYLDTSTNTVKFM